MNDRGDPPAPEVERFAMAHFSQANPVGPGQHELPALLRRVAGTIRRLGDVEIHNLVLDPPLEPEEADARPSVTVYYRDKGARGAGR